MDDKTVQKANELLTWLMDTVKESGEFVKSQAPEVGGSNPPPAIE